MPRPARLVALVAIAAFALVACGDDDAETTETETPETEAPDPEIPDPEIPDPEAPEADGDCEVGVAGDPGTESTVTIPDCPPPTSLAVTELASGEGDAAEPGDTVQVHYTGVAWSDGQEFDASWARGEPFAFMLGMGRVIPGWDLGVEGMQPGARRVLVIPPGLAYGEDGAGDVIGPDETLVFVVDLVAIG